MIAGTHGRRTVTPTGDSWVPLVRNGASLGSYIASGDAAWIPILECMKDPICVSPELSIEAAAALFLAEDISGAPVVGPEGELLGMITKTDLVRRRSEARVRDAMTAPAWSVPDTAQLGEAAALMVEKRVHHVAVVSREGLVTGVVSPLDLLAWVI